jgi:hypothetical protein
MTGFDDIFVYAAVPAVIEMADDLLAEDGCLNFFAGPTDSHFKVPFNFYNVHYNSTHVVGTSGGSTDDMKEGNCAQCNRPAATVVYGDAYWRP